MQKKEKGNMLCRKPKVELEQGKERSYNSPL